MSLPVRLFLGCLVALTSTSAAGAQFRMQRSFVPMRMNPMVMQPMVMNRLMGNPSPFMNPYATAYNNPYMMSNPYAAASSGYGGGSGGGYSTNSGASLGMGDMGSSAGYSGGPGYYQATSGAANVDQTSASAGFLRLDSLLTALGIPNKNGQFDWPLAFRLIPPGEDRDTMRQTESMVRVAVMQAAGGNASPAMNKEAARDVRKMRHWLRDHEAGMAEGTYRAGSAFLRRLEGALKLIGS